MAYNWGDAISQIAGAIVKRNEDRGNSKALASLYEPIEPNMADNTFQDLSKQNSAGNKKIAQGLLPTGFQTQAPTANMIGQGLLGQPQQQAPAPMITNPMEKYSQANNPANVTSKPKDWNGIQKDIQQQGYKRIQEMAKTMSPEMLRTYLPEARRVINEQIAQSKGEYDKNAETQAWDSFDKAPDYKTKMMTGIKAGLNPQLLKMALDTGIEIKTQDVGDKFISYGVDTHNNRLIDLKTGEQLDPSVFTKGISAEANQRAELTREGHALTARGQDLSYSASVNRGGGGGGSAGSTANKASMYKWASAYSLQPTGEMDVMGKPVMTRVQNNPQLARQLEQELGYVGGQGGGGNGEDQRIAQARAAGYSEEEIQAFIGGGQPQQQQPRPQQYQPVQNPFADDPLLFGGD